VRNHIRAFVELAVEAFELRGPVYDFGPCRGDARPIIAPWRPLFLGQKYVSCGARWEPGVDRLVDPTRLAIADAAARTVIAVEVLERSFEPRRAAEELTRVVAPGGVMLMAASLNQPLDDDPADYWRLTPSCIKRLLGPLEAALVAWQGAERFPHTVFGIGFKSPSPAGLVPCMNHFIEGYQRWVANAARTVPWPRKLKAAMTHWFVDRPSADTCRDFHQVRFSLDAPFDPDWKSSLFPKHEIVNIPARVDLS
jgi:hypothetical protein